MAREEPTLMALAHLPKYAKFQITIYSVRLYLFHNVALDIFYRNPPRCVFILVLSHTHESKGGMETNLTHTQFSPVSEQQVSQDGLINAEDISHRMPSEGFIQKITCLLFSVKGIISSKIASASILLPRCQNN